MASGSDDGPHDIKDSEDDSGEHEMADTLFDAINVPEEKRADVFEALTGLIDARLAKARGGSDDTGE
jgi:hypothetical protein